MSIFFHQTIYYLRYLLKKKTFSYLVVLLLVLSFFIIPSPDADYVTFFIGKTTAVPDKYWLGNLAAVFSNISISIILFYMILGEREKEIKQKLHHYEDTSVISRFAINFYKIVALYTVSLIFLFILNGLLILANIGTVDILQYIRSLVYFCIPFLFLFAVICFVVEYFVPYKGLKYILYYGLFMIIFTKDKILYNPIGIYELSLYLGEYINQYNYSVGILAKSQNLSFIEIKDFPEWLFLPSKILWVVVALVTAVFFSKIKISRKISVVEQDKNIVKITTTQPTKYQHSKAGVRKSFAFPILLQKDFYLFSQAFSKSNIFVLVIFWVLIFFTSGFLQHMFLPLLFLFSLSVNGNFLCKLFYYDISYTEDLSPFSKTARWLSKFIILLSFYTVLLVTYFLSIGIGVKAISIIIGFAGLAAIQISLSTYLKNSTLIDIIYIVIFATYLAGSPLINILQY
ncbi:MAG: hypothetical protein Q4G16_04640 [Cruoricaptor ignavus]|nr:hypothetical protein [Cruoricaptor ignavus]